MILVRKTGLSLAEHPKSMAAASPIVVKRRAGPVKRPQSLRKTGSGGRAGTSWRDAVLSINVRPERNNLHILRKVTTIASDALTIRVYRSFTRIPAKRENTAYNRTTPTP